MDGSVVATMNYLVPASGTTSGYPVSGVFSATPVVQDWRQVNLDGEQFVPSGVFIDNSQGTGPLVVFIQNSNFSIVCPAGGRVSRQYPAPLDQITSITGKGQATVTFVNFPVLPTSDVPANASSAVTIADGANATFGAVADAPAANDTGNFTFMGFVKRMSASLTNLFATGAGAQTVQGNSPAGAADVGSPVKIGGLYSNAGAIPAQTAGTRLDTQVDSYGNIRALTTLASLATGDGLISATFGYPVATSSNLPTGRILPVNMSMLFNGTTYDRQRGDLQGAFTQQDVTPDWAYVAATGGITNTTIVNLKTGVAGQINYLSSITYMNTAAVAAELLVLNVATPILRIPLPASMTSPVTLQFPRPLRGIVNGVLAVGISVTGTATYVNAQGFTK